jgi:hypothetical protein
MCEKIARIIGSQVGDGFTGEDYDRGWHDAMKRIANELANYFFSQNHFFDRQAFLRACGFGTDQAEPAQQQSWKAVPYNDKTELANQFAVATIVDSNGNIVADVFSHEATALIETAPELKRKLAECEKDYEYLRDVLKEIETKARDY